MARAVDDDVTRVVSGANEDTSPQAREARSMPRGVLVGRYVVLDPVGAGGMGVVYAAYDPELDRKVALKILAPRRRRENRLSGADQRLLREAQAMAKLTHPNVVAVYDAGTFENRVFIAMEFVEGRTLRQWLAEQSPDWRTIVDKLVAAGRGLAAAHRADIVHRDFKPTNVMLRSDGTVRVLDFGLARRLDGSVSLSPEEALSASSSGRGLRAPLEPLTQTGMVTGTPAYMAPEQFSGRDVDARSDQFSFCVTLWEAVYGQRPFEADDYESLAQVVRIGRLPGPPPGSHVSAGVRRILARGLSVRPEDRFASMDGLLDALQRAAAPLRRRPIVWAALIGSAGLAVGAIGLRSASSPCTDGADKLDGIWDATRQSTMADAFVKTQLGYAADTWSRVQAHVDDYTAQWRAGHLAACEATHVRHEQSELMLDRRMACLQHRLDELRALSDLLVEADAPMVEKSVQAAHGLGDIPRCADIDALMVTVAAPDDPEAAAKVESVRADLARVGVLEDAGRPQLAAELAASAVEDAEATGYRPVIAEARQHLGAVRGQLGQGEGAEAILYQALLDAEATGHVEVELRARISLVTVTGFRMARPDDGHEHAAFARALLQRFAPSGDVVGALEISEGIVYYAEGKNDEARRSLEQGLQLRRAAFGADSPKVADVLVNLGATMIDGNRVDEGLKSFDRAREIYERALGPRHPAVAAAMHNLAAGHLKKREYDRARGLLEHAIEIWRDAYGPTNADLGRAYQNLGVVEMGTGHPQAALESYRWALQAKKAVYGDRHPSIAITMGNVADALNRLGRHEDALAEVQQARSIAEAAMDPQHAVFGPIMSNLGSAHLGLGHLDEARAALERSLQVHEANDAAPADVAGVQRILADVRWRQGEHAQARALAKAAADTFADLGEPYRRDHDDARRWLDEHPAPAQPSRPGPGG